MTTPVTASDHVRSIVDANRRIPEATTADVARTATVIDAATIARQGRPGGA